MDEIEIQIENAKRYKKEIRNKYSMLFREGIGREVLADILHNCHFPGTTGSIYESLDPNNKELIGRYNVGLEIAEKAGILQSIGVHVLGLKSKVVPE